MAESESGSGRKRRLKGIQGKIVRVIMVLFPLYVLLYISGVFKYFGVFIYPLRQDAMVLLFAMVMVYVLFPATKGAPRDRIPWYDWIAIALCIVTNLYIIIYCLQIIKRPHVLPSVMEQAFAVIIVILILEGVRRTTSPILSIIGLVFFVYPFAAGYMPGFLYSRSQSLGRVSEMLYVFPNGIYGSLLDLLATIIAAFLLFGAFLEASGAGSFFISLAHAVAGRFRGGPAKIAVIASGFVGTISGSGMANVAMTGPITIPMMKKVGYQAHFAAAVEAAASNGGPLTPPVLGTVAFLMMDFLGVSYMTIVYATIIPAVLYYTGLFLMLDFEAAKKGLRGLPVAELPSAKKVLKEGWLYFVPLILLVSLIAVFNYSPQTACLYTIAVIVMVSWLMKGKGMKPRKIADALSRGFESMPSLSVVVCIAAILLAAVELTGVGIRIGGGLVALAGGNLFVLLLLMAAASFVLGMGMPSAAVYILLVVLMAPALVMVGIPPIVAHMFLFYAGHSAMLTPPVCLTVFVAAAIAECPFVKAGWQATRLGIGVFIVPFIFSYHTELLMMGTAGQIVFTTIACLMGMFFVSVGFGGYFLRPVGWLERAVCFAAAVALFLPGGLTTSLLGLGLGSVVVVSQLFAARRVKLAASGRG